MFELMAGGYGASVLRGDHLQLNKYIDVNFEIKLSRQASRTIQSRASRRAFAAPPAPAAFCSLDGRRNLSLAVTAASWRAEDVARAQTDSEIHSYARGGRGRGEESFLLTNQLGRAPRRESSFPCRLLSPSPKPPRINFNKAQGLGFSGALLSSKRSKLVARASRTRERASQTSWSGTKTTE